MFEDTKTIQPGTLTERVLGNADKIHLIDNIHGPARGKQVEWLSTKSYKDGMTTEQHEAFNAAMEKANEEWENGLSDAQRNVRRL